MLSVFLGAFLPFIYFLWWSVCSNFCLFLSWIIFFWVLRVLKTYVTDSGALDGYDLQMFFPVSDQAASRPFNSIRWEVQAETQPPLPASLPNLKIPSRGLPGTPVAKTLHAVNIGGPGSIPGQGTRSHLLQLRVPRPCCHRDRKSLCPYRDPAQPNK